jgi:hypothetical protein
MLPISSLVTIDAFISNSIQYNYASKIKLVLHNDKFKVDNSIEDTVQMFNRVFTAVDQSLMGERREFMANYNRIKPGIVKLKQFRVSYANRWWELLEKNLKINKIKHKGTDMNILNFLYIIPDIKSHLTSIEKKCHILAACVLGRKVNVKIIGDRGGKLVWVKAQDQDDETKEYSGEGIAIGVLDNIKFRILVRTEKTRSFHEYKSNIKKKSSITLEVSNNIKQRWISSLIAFLKSKKIKYAGLLRKVQIVVIPRFGYVYQRNNYLIIPYAYVISGTIYENIKKVSIKNIRSHKYMNQSVVARSKIMKNDLDKTYYGYDPYDRSFINIDNIGSVNIITGSLPYAEPNTDCILTSIAKKYLKERNEETTASFLDINYIKLSNSKVVFDSVVSMTLSVSECDKVIKEYKPSYNMNDRLIIKNEKFFQDKILLNNLLSLYKIAKMQASVGRKQAILFPTVKAEIIKGLSDRYYKLLSIGIDLVTQNYIEKHNDLDLIGRLSHRKSLQSRITKRHDREENRPLRGLSTLIYKLLCYKTCKYKFTAAIAEESNLVIIDVTPTGTVYDFGCGWYKILQRLSDIDKVDYLSQINSSLSSMKIDTDNNIIRTNDEAFETDIMPTMRDKTGKIEMFNTEIAMNIEDTYKRLQLNELIIDENKNDEVFESFNLNEFLDNRPGINEEFTFHMNAALLEFDDLPSKEFELVEDDDKPFFK